MTDIKTPLTVKERQAVQHVEITLRGCIKHIPKTGAPRVVKDILLSNALLLMTEAREKLKAALAL
ncbi:MAG: hypothetical protein ACRBI6_04685 [Acidimicrobiales bacterium]